MAIASHVILSIIKYIFDILVMPNAKVYETITAKPDKRQLKNIV